VPHQPLKHQQLIVAAGNLVNHDPVLPERRD